MGKKNFKFSKKRKLNSGSTSPYKSYDGGVTESSKNWEEIEKTNENFSKFYQAQSILSEEEWEIFIESLKKTLPTTFRLTGTKSQTSGLLHALETKYFSQMENLQVDGELIPKPTPIPWYPGKLAFHFEASRKVLRKSEVLGDFRRMLINESEQGNICRQEAVSMIPPLFLDVQSHHKILDMCAAPGSKTTQLVEMLHSKENPSSPSTIPTGLVVANDANNKRCYMLVHQTKRLASPCLVVTNHDASILPTVYYEKTSASSQSIPILYDRILCDVPCSGDGTIRKNPLLWKRWKSNIGPSLHPLQAKILCRGIQMLAVGGILVYSTCSLNPLENEAVLCNVLSQFQDSIHLMDVSEKLPNLKRRKGLSSWVCMGKDGDIYSKYEDVSAQDKNLLFPHMFPPSKEEAHKYKLHRSMRVLPHDQNTGGFFIAVIKKTSPIGNLDSRVSNRKGRNAATSAKNHSASDQENKTISAVESEILEENQDGKSSSLILPPGESSFKEEPFVFLTDETDQEAQETWKTIQEFYQFKQDFPSHLLLTRKEGGKKHHLYLVSEGVREFLKGYSKNGLKIINTGIKIFTRQESVECPCQHRFSQEGAPCLLPFLLSTDTSSRFVHVSFNDMIVLLKEEAPMLCRFSEPTQNALANTTFGPLVLIFDPRLAETSSPSVVESPLMFVGWKGKLSCRLYVAKKERKSFLHILEGSESSAESPFPPQVDEENL